MSAGAARSRLLAASLIVVLALAARLGYWTEVRGTALDRWHLMGHTDMATYVQQALQFARGDWLARSPFHPYHEWQAVAPPEKWLAWYGPHSFHQAPGYPALIALASRVVADPLVWAKVVQLVLGAIGSATALLLAWRLGGPVAGWAAGVLWATYGPLIYLEAQLLREGPALFGILAILLATVTALERARVRLRPELLAAAGIGVAVGLLHVFHEIGVLLLVVVVAALAARRARTAPRTAGLVLAAVLGGYLVGFSPLLARNLMVGAPPLSVSSRTVINLVLACEAGASRGGATFGFATPAVVRILDRAHGTTLGAVRGIWESYDGDVARLAANWLRRVAAIGAWAEEPDNTSFHFYRDHSWLLALGPTFALLLPLGVAGAVAVGLGAWRARRSPGASDDLLVEAWRRHPEGHCVLWLYLAVVAGSLSLVPPVGRFRLYLLPCFVVHAGVGVGLAAAALRGRRPRTVLLLGAVALGAAVVQQASTRAAPRDLRRTADFAIATVLSVEGRQYEAAEAFAEGGVRHSGGDPVLYAELGAHLERHRQWARAAVAYQKALAAAPGLDFARQGLQRARAAQGLPP